MRDQFGRRIRYLRISVTDRCNLRCTYCMPEEGLDWIPKPEMLAYEEISEIVRQMSVLGLERVRITGGEPLVRKDLPDLVRMIAAVPGIDDISLSTNAILLPRFAVALRKAGVARVNVSLDTLDRYAFEEIARRPARRFDETMEGLRAAEEAGFAPIKINCVIMRGLNDHEVVDFAEITRERPWHVRFIELMPVGRNLHLTDRFISTDEVLEKIRSIEDLLPDPGPRGNGPAVYYRFPGGAGTVGAITPLSHNYCERCNRMRLTADGKLRTCLFGDHEVDLKGPLRATGRIEDAVAEALAGKPKRHYLELGTAAGSGGLAALSQVGG
ncbi:MAG: GTP 3',8-cyclase MoaA [Gemmatimonadales bacterium]|nr:GTP 3',8-cyclase MoaA [Gemmatimonadales bacterium]MYG48418.1 GTP 3',8-cyclase MoaA [Gemmatimonadales bacterium]MYK00368.1 GTP 3',8-cyclase MoaA [Candidatus Palauibacter ramosifaciens]